MNKHPLSAINYMLAGFELLTQRGLKKFIIIPVVVNFILFIGLFFLLRHYIFELNDWFLQYVPSWLQWLGTIIWLLFFLSFIVVFAYSFVTIVNIIAAPFNSLLSEKVTFYLTGQVMPSSNVFGLLKDVPRVIGRQLLVLCYYIPRAFLIFIIFFIPFLQTIAPILWVLFHAWFLTMTFLDYPTDNAKISFQETRAWMNQHKWLSLSMGLCILAVTLVPILNLIAIPAAVAAATKLWVEEG